MEKKNKKFTVALCAMAFALVAAVGGLIGVWAAANQTVTSSFDVSYTVGANVAANVSVAWTSTDNAVGASASASFGATEAQTSKDLALGAIAMTPVEGAAEHIITFVYSFTNTGDTTFTATLTNKVEGVNTEIKSTTPENATVTVAAGQTQTITIVVKVVDMNKAASYATADGKGISIALAAQGA